MAGTIVEHAWDGAWFRRAYDFYGNMIGSCENDEGQIFIEPQGICILAGIGIDDGRAARALSAVRDRLATPHGIALQQPAFSAYQLRLGEISSYPPGYKENGGIFCHTNPWVMIAEVMAGSPGDALDYYLRINPSARETISDIHRCEPYVYAQMIAGPDAASHGEAKNSWLSGTAAWNYVAATQWLIGIRPELDGLRIDPRLPAGSSELRVTRRFRGATYRIVVRETATAEGRDGRVTRLVVDGQPIDGNLAPLPVEPGVVMEIEATHGAPVHSIP
jgi:cellobiose phosphorylase